MYTLNLLAIALELAPEDPATKTWPASSGSTSSTSPTPWAIAATTAWDCGTKKTVFLRRAQSARWPHVPMKIRSMVGIDPAVRGGNPGAGSLDKLPDFKRRLEWFIDNRPDLRQRGLHAHRR